jgi:hypothetical protein
MIQKKPQTLILVAQWFLCIDYSLQQEREQPGFNLDENNSNEITTMDQLKQMKIIPLKDQSRLVSIEEFNQRAILFPLDKSTKFDKHLRIVLEDLPTIDERLLQYIENKYPRRLESIKSLLKDLGKLLIQQYSRKMNYYLTLKFGSYQVSSKLRKLEISVSLFKSPYFTN